VLRPLDVLTASSNDPSLLLRGYTLAVVTSRRKHPLVRSIAALGAQVVPVQVIGSAPCFSEDALGQALEELVTFHVDEVVLTSALGFHRLLKTASRLGLRDPLIRTLRGADLLISEGAVARRLRNLGLREFSRASAASNEELMHFLQRNATPGQRVAVEIDDRATGEACRALRAAGMEVVELPTYGASGPGEKPPIGVSETAVGRLFETIDAGVLDALVLDSGAAADGLLAVVDRAGRLPDMVHALAGRAVVVGRGPSAVEPLRALGITAVASASGLSTELVQIAASLLRSASPRFTAAGHRLEVRGHAVLVDGRFHPVPSRQLAVLRALARDPGRVLSRAEIRRFLPGRAVDDHAVEAAISRLRRHLPDLDLVQTVLRRGYRLADPDAA
jgi:uroporphyrinogen-III synthase